MHVCKKFWFYYGRLKIKTNIKKLIGFYWKYQENIYRNISQYSEKYRNTFFLYCDTPSVWGALPEFFL